MAGRSVGDFLIRVVLDEAFRDLALSDPRRAFEGYDLSDSEREILSAGDERLVGLLSAAGAGGGSCTEQVADRAPGQPDSGAGGKLPPVKLLLSLNPRLTQEQGGAPTIAYSASLQAWPGDDHAEHTRADVQWKITITPTIVSTADDALQVSYSAAIRPLGGGFEPTQPRVARPMGAADEPSSDHSTPSAKVKALAQEAKVCQTGQRYPKLIELIHALQPGDGRG